MAGLLDEMKRRLGPDRPDTAEPPAPPSRPESGLPAAQPPAAPSAGRPLRVLPQRKTMEQWLALAAALAVAALVCWVMTAAWNLASASRAAASARVTLPVLAAYGSLERVGLLPRGSLVLESTFAQAPGEDRLLRAWQNFASFENSRAEPVLRSARSVVQAVVPGSAAADAGLQPGDLITQINGSEAGYVWDVYKGLTGAPIPVAQLLVQRGEATQQLTIKRPAGSVFDMTNHGLLFAVPAHVRYLGRTDCERLRSQLQSGFVESWPAEWRQRYVEGLLALSVELVSNLPKLAPMAPGSPGYVSSEDLVMWYHRSFGQALDAFRLDQGRAWDRQSTALAQLAWGLLAGGVLTLLGLALAVRRYWQP